jgi:hypothetical protein
MSKREQIRRQWQPLVARFERSGKSQAIFAAEAGVGLPAFRYWLYKLRRAIGNSRTTAPIDRAAVGAGRDTAVRLLPVEVRGGLAQMTAVEVDVATLRLRVPGGTDPAYVAALVGALRGAERC